MPVNMEPICWCYPETLPNERDGTSLPPPKHSFTAWMTVASDKS